MTARMLVCKQSLGAENCMGQTKGYFQRISGNGSNTDIEKGSGRLQYLGAIGFHCIKQNYMRKQ